MNYPSAKVKIKNKDGAVTAYQLIIAVPGVTKDKVHLSYLDDILEIGIEEHAPEVGEVIEVINNEIEFNGNNISMNCEGLNLSKTKATVENGLITIIIPINEKPKKNEIKIG